jgi:hypothetical protein
MALVRRSPVMIVAVSIKSAAQALEAHLEGAAVVSAQGTVIRKLINYMMSQETA